MKKLFSKDERESINPKLEELKEFQGEIDRLREAASKTIATIREGLSDVVLAFIDIVGSTEYKMQHSDEPEKWILMLQQFGELMTDYVQELGGKIVKYIGDEVMAVFDRETYVNDALNFVMRIEEIEARLREVTKEAIRIKIAVDKGKVFMLRYRGHEELDPQGTPVDRCARIAKYAEAGMVLSTFEFVQHSEGRATWTQIGEPNLKGIGRTSVYQFGIATKEINESIVTDLSKLDEVIGEQILADSGKTLTHDPRYVVTQGGSTVEPSWEFDLVPLSIHSVTGQLRTSGGTEFNKLTEEEKKDWQDFAVTLHENKSIIIQRHLSGKWAGNTQFFRSNSGPVQKTVKDKTAMVWDGTWSGTGADNADGSFIVYLD